MRNIFAISIFCFFSIFSYSQNGVLGELYNGTVEVNSRTKIGGTSRKVVGVRVPYDANGVFCTIYVNKIGGKSPAWAGRQALLYGLTGKYKRGGTVTREFLDELIDMGQSRYENINMYVLPSYAVDKFKRRAEYNFSYLEKWKDVGSATEYISVNGGEILHIGFHNTNPTVGLNVHLQIVATQ